MRGKATRKSIIAGACTAVALLVLMMVVLVGCGGGSTTTTTAPSTTTTVAGGPTTTLDDSTMPSELTIRLTGDEVVPSVLTTSVGTAIFKFVVGASGFSVQYEVDVTNATDVIAADIHLGAKGANGPVIVPLFAGPAKSGAFSGVLITGTITQANLAGSMAGKTLQDLAGAVLSGQTYVDVDTMKHPTGEIRGQITTPAAAGSSTPTS